ncbi:RNA polymerase sigma factor, sigma-70 family [Corynebacterium variabile]|uniref:RNA polymerase sigma factor, sigma-70 family n=2 Tax=Corynebacterium variabile TaxID=1727 RepID=A0A0X2NM61_9CORY|nr:RNA polymerase sigma factor, sigma-70 family [Corynebacterium variabile]
MTWDEERECVRRAKSGDGEAFGALWKCAEKKVWAVCLGITSNRSDAEEAIAEAMCKSWQGLDRFLEKSRFSTWLCQIASNICKNKVSRRREFPDSETGTDLASNTTDIGDRVADTQAVRWAVSQLSDEFREAIVLREVGGLAYKEIAIQQGVNIQTVKTRIFRARKALQDLLGGDDATGANTPVPVS